MQPTITSVEHDINNQIENHRLTATVFPDTGPCLNNLLQQGPLTPCDMYVLAHYPYSPEFVITPRPFAASGFSTYFCDGRHHLHSQHNLGFGWLAGGFHASMRQLKQVTFLQTKDLTPQGQKQFG